MPDSPTPPRKRKPAMTARGIILHRDHVLLLSAEDPGRPWHFLPGGHVENGETLAQACAREIEEETSLKVIVERPLYLREFIAERHQRRSKFMPPTHHVLALVFLCSLDPEHHDLAAPFDRLGKFPGDADGSGAVKGMVWQPRKSVDQIEIMPPHVTHALLGDFPPPAEAGVEFWEED